MSHPPRFRQIQSLIGKQTIRKPRKNGPRLETVNALTQRIVEHIYNRGHFATRPLTIYGTYRENLKKFVSSL